MGCCEGPAPPPKKWNSDGYHFFKKGDCFVGGHYNLSRTIGNVLITPPQPIMPMDWSRFEEDIRLVNIKCCSEAAALFTRLTKTTLPNSSRVFRAPVSAELELRIYIPDDRNFDLAKRGLRPTCAEVALWKQGGDVVYRADIGYEDVKHFYHKQGARFCSTELIEEVKRVKSLLN